MKLWVVGQIRGYWSLDGTIWELQGVFDTEEQAVSACIKESYFIMSTILNERLPDETCLPPEGTRFPLLENI